MARAALTAAAQVGENEAETNKAVGRAIQAAFPGPAPAPLDGRKMTAEEEGHVMGALRAGTELVEQVGEWETPALPTTIQAMAAELAPELDALFNEFLAGLDGDPKNDRSRDALKEFLWDNKVGLLRIAQAMQVSPAPAPLGRADDGLVLTAQEISLIERLRDDDRTLVPDCEVLDLIDIIDRLAARPSPPVQSGEWNGNVGNAVDDMRARLFLIQNAPISANYCTTAVNASSLIGCLADHIATLTQVLAEAGKLIDAPAKEADDWSDNGINIASDAWCISNATKLTVGFLRACRAWRERWQSMGGSDEC